MSSAPLTAEEESQLRTQFFQRRLRTKFFQLKLEEPNVATKGLTKAVELEWEKMKDFWGKYQAQKEVIQMLEEELLHRPILPSGRSLLPSELPERDQISKDNERYVDKRLPLALERLGLS